MSGVAFITKAVLLNEHMSSRSMEGCTLRLVVLIMLVTEVTILYWLIRDANAITRSACVALFALNVALIFIVLCFSDEL